MTHSENCTALVKSFEGLELNAYQDEVGVWTIGYGHTGQYPEAFRLNGLIKPNDTLTQQEAEDLLSYDLSRFDYAVSQMVKGPLQQHQFDALVDFAFNLGAAALRGSTLLRLLNAGDVTGAAAQFEAWDHVGKAVFEGLLRRRTAEKSMFLGEL